MTIAQQNNHKTESWDFEKSFNFLKRNWLIFAIVAPLGVVSVPIIPLLLGENGKLIIYAVIFTPLVLTRFKKNGGIKPPEPPKIWSQVYRRAIIKFILATVVMPIGLVHSLRQRNFVYLLASIILFEVLMFVFRPRKKKLIEVVLLESGPDEGEHFSA